MSNPKNGIGSTADLDQTFEAGSLEDWKHIAEKSLRGASVDSLNKRTANGLETAPLYTDRPAGQTSLNTRFANTHLATLGQSFACHR